MAGATAATAAGVTASPASATTIHLINNYISGGGGNHLNADLTGDGHADIAITGAQFFRTGPITTEYGFDFNSLAAVLLNGIFAKASHQARPIPPSINYARVGSHATSRFYYPVSVTGLIDIFFSDKHINNGKLTEGWLEVSAFAPGATVQLDSLTFQTPDQGSSLALLAIGAGGVLAFRRWRNAQQRS